MVSFPQFPQAITALGGASWTKDPNTSEDDYAKHDVPEYLLTATPLAKNGADGR